MSVRPEALLAAYEEFRAREAFFIRSNAHCRAVAVNHMTGSRGPYAEHVVASTFDPGMRIAHKVLFHFRAEQRQEGEVNQINGNEKR